MLRKVGFQDDVDPNTRIVGAIQKYVAIDGVVILFLLAAILYLHTDILSSLGIVPHQFGDTTVMTYTMIAVAVTAILSALFFFLTVWPVLREARNVK